MMIGLIKTVHQIKLAFMHHNGNQMQETNNRILVTGGAGFVGSNLIKRLRKNYPNAHIVSLDNYFTGNRDNHIPGVKYMSGEGANAIQGRKAAELRSYVAI